MYKGFMIIVKTGQAREVLTSTDKPFDWFPELEKVFENFSIKELEMEIENTEEGIEKKFFKIIRFPVKEIPVKVPSMGDTLRELAKGILNDTQ